MITDDTEESFKITVFSFGFKYGSPEDAPIMLDVRFLPNPYWEEGMRHLTGLDKDVADYVLNSESGMEFLDRLIPLFTFLVEQNKAAGKAEIRIGIGCTGGHHRSVAVVEKLSFLLSKDSVDLHIFHRDLGKE